MAFFRIILGIIVLLDLLTRGCDLVAHYTDSGLLPRFELLENYINEYRFSTYLISGKVWFVSFLFSFTAFLAILLILGIHTNWVLFFLWVLIQSLHNRNYMVTNAGDTYLRLMLFWSIFLPLGERGSVDRSGIELKNKIHFSVASIGFTIQLLSIYFFTLIHKNHPVWFIDFTAVYYSLNLKYITTDFGFWIGQYFSVTKILTIGTLVIEFLAPLFILMPCKKENLRLYAVLLMSSLHCGIFLTMNIGLFPLISLAGWLPLIPSSFWDRIQNRINLKQSSFNAYFDADCFFCKKLIYVLKTFLYIPKMNILLAQSNSQIEEIMLKNNTWVLKKESGEVLIRGEALYFVFTQSPYLFFFPKIFVPFIDYIYKLIAENRASLSVFTKKIDIKKDSFTLGKIWQFLLSIHIFLFLIWNAGTVKWVRDLSRLEPYMKTFSFDQEWNMFAPYPRKDDGYFIFEGYLKDGTPVDPFQSENANLNNRWRKYLRNIWLKKHQSHRKLFSNYLCSKNNQNVLNANKKLSHFNIYFMKEELYEVGERGELQKIPIWSQKCLQ